jgi:carboxyl-terminal processing protease
MTLKKKYGFLIFLVLLAFVGFIYSSLNVFTALRSVENTLRIINSNYVNEVDMTKLLDRAIEAITDSLDSHTTYLRERDYEDLMVHTEGEFGGLGIRISKRGEYITIISPIEGTPAYDAGLMQGDKIVKIDGISTKDMKLDKGVSMMRGKPETDVTITISRKGSDREIDFTIKRAVIKIKSVPYAGIVEDNVGYIVVNSFSKSTVNELKVALDSLIDSGAEKFILDLRNNSGGILDGAAKVASFFIEKGKEIVYTEGKSQTARDSYHSDNGLYSKYPLVVLVSPFSASGSEIVAGAVQDWDRGFLLGSRTFGKGSVQRVYPLPGGRAIKLTIARYHTPSGRCIDKELVEDTTKLFHTRGPLNRKVKGGGGIIPDSILKVKFSPFYEKIYSYGFDFIVDYISTNPNVETVTPHMIEKFKSKVKEELKKDSTKTIDYLANYPGFDDLSQAEMKEMMEEFQKSVREYLKEDSKGKSIGFSEKEWNDAMDEIKRGLKIRLAYNRKGIKGRYEASISDDEHVLAALGKLKKAKVPRDVFSVQKR